MTVSSANKTNSNDSIASNSGLSKSQKKRMKQKAAKSRKESNTIPVVAPSNSVNMKSLSSYANLREDLKRLGYSYSEIDTTLEDMWNLKLQYDELESVLAFIRSRAIQKDMETTNPLSVSTSTASSSHNVAAESELQAPPQSLSVISADQIGATDDMMNGEEEKLHITKNKERKEQKEALLMTLKERLSMVAGFESLPDTIVALTEWIAKAANSSEVEEMCNTTSSSALNIVVQRSIMGNSADISLLLKLIGTIFKSTGLPPLDVNMSVDHLAKLLNLAQMSVKETSPNTANNISTTISNLIVKTISQSLKEVQCSTQNGVDKIQQLEKDIERLASSLAGNGTSKPQVMKLMTKRDSHKKAAEKYSTVMSITLINSVMATDHTQPTMVTAARLDDETAREELIATLVGNNSETVNSNKIKFESLKRQLAKANSSTFAQKDSLNKEREACEKRRNVITDRIQELRLEIQKLEQEDEVIQNKILQMNGQISALVGSQSSEIRELENELEKSSKIVKLEETAKSLVEKMHAFESTILGASTSTYSKESNPIIFNPDQVARKIGIFIVRMMNYFNSEAEMVTFIRNRVKELEAKIPGLQFEIEECASLGMTTNVSQMKKTLNETRQNIIEDTEFISALQGEAEKMRDDLMKLLHNFENVKYNKSSMSVHVSMINGIKEALVKIGLDTDGGLSAHFDRIASVSSRLSNGNRNVIKVDNAQKQRTTENYVKTQLLKQNSELSHSKKLKSTDTTPKQSEKTQSIPATAPVPREVETPKIKMGWAIKASSSQAAAKSFLDIQKEELQLKEVQ